MEEGDFPFIYLGVPLHLKMLNTKDCRPIVDKIIYESSFSVLGCSSTQVGFSLSGVSLVGLKIFGLKFFASLKS